MANTSQTHDIHHSIFDRLQAVNTLIDSLLNPMKTPKICFTSPEIIIDLINLDYDELLSESERLRAICN